MFHVKHRMAHPCIIFRYTFPMTTPLKQLSIAQVREFVSEAHLPSFRADQVLTWVYGKGARSYDKMTNLPKAMREQLARELPLYTPRIVRAQVSRDGSRKYLLQFEDGAKVETVGLPSPDGRLTACVSSQAGCAMGCTFCATGAAGFTRNLAPGEIVDQLFAVQGDFAARVSNVVVMGQGEPFANYDSTLAALRIMNHAKLLNIGARHITVSTCGLVQGIRRFAGEPEQFTLAVSLHAARQDVRDKLMPGVAHLTLEALHDRLQTYHEQSGRRFSFEYALMKGLNDTSADLEALVAYCADLNCHVNLIPLNPIEGAPVQPSPRKTMELWEKRLTDEGIPASIRRSRGADIDAACGQLASRAAG